MTVGYLPGGESIKFESSLTIRMKNIAKDYELVEKHTDSEGNDWYIIRVFSKKIDRWLGDMCETHEDICGTAPMGKFNFPCYNVHGSLMSYITLLYT